MLHIENPATFDWVNISLNECAFGNCLDTYFTLKLYSVLKKELEQRKQLKLMDRLLHSLLPFLSLEEYKGIPVSQSHRRLLDKTLKNSIEDLEFDIYKNGKVPGSVNIDSNDEQAEIFFSEKGFGLHSPRKTDGGKDSVDKDCLVTLKEQIEEELERREKSAELAK